MQALAWWWRTVKIAIVFEPDPDLGTDPLDDAHEPRRLGIFIDAANEDVLLLHRRFGEQFDGGIRTEVWSTGVWEHLSVEEIMGAIEAIT